MHVIGQTIAVGIGCAAYAFVFNTKMNRVLYAAFSSMLITGVYFFITQFYVNLFLDAMICALLATAYAEIMARVKKAPSTVFLIPPIMSLVPGGYLYYTMYFLVTGNSHMAKINANATLLAALGIAVGIVIVNVVMSGSESFRKARHK